LVQLSKSRTDEARLIERAKIVLRCLAGERNDEIAARLGTQPATVATWRKRFAERGLAGLKDRPRSGKPATLPPDLRQRLRRQLEAPPPKGFSSWDGGSLAAALGVSDDAVWRILRQDGIQLRRQRSWCVSTDPQFAAKAADIIGLYLDPPFNALVLWVDEKPSIQALQRKTVRFHDPTSLSLFWKTGAAPCIVSVVSNLRAMVIFSLFFGGLPTCAGQP
jgi:transposase